MPIYTPAPPRWTTLRHQATPTPTGLQVNLLTDIQNFLTLVVTYTKPFIAPTATTRRGVTYYHHNRYTFYDAFTVPQEGSLPTSNHTFNFPLKPGCNTVYYFAFDGTNFDLKHSVSPIYALFYCIASPPSFLQGAWHAYSPVSLIVTHIGLHHWRRSFLLNNAAQQPYDQLIYYVIYAGNNTYPNIPFAFSPSTAPNPLLTNFLSHGGYTDQYGIFTMSLPANTLQPRVSYDYSFDPGATSDLFQLGFGLPAGAPLYNWAGRVLLNSPTGSPQNNPAIYFEPGGLTNMLSPWPNQATGVPFTLQQGAPSQTVDVSGTWRSTKP